MITHKYNTHTSFLRHLGVFHLRGRRHVVHDRGTAVDLLLSTWLSIVCGSCHCLLLGLGVLAVGAEDGDLLALPAARSRLGGGLEQVDGLAVLLCRTKIWLQPTDE